LLLETEKRLVVALDVRVSPLSSIAISALVIETEPDEVPVTTRYLFDTESDEPLHVTEVPEIVRVPDPLRVHVIVNATAVKSSAEDSAHCSACNFNIVFNIIFLSEFPESIAVC
jgi:hypothetical protein